MGRINDMLTRHQWLQFAIGWVLAAGIVLLVFPGRSPVATLLRVVLYSAVAIGMAVRRRRREKAAAGGSADDLVTLDHMIRKGQVPTDPARRDAMRDLVDQRLHRTRHRKAALVVMAVLLTAVAASTFFTTSPPRAAAYCVFSAAFFAYLVVVGGAALHRLRRLRDSLGATAQGTDREAAGNHSARHAA